MLTRERSIASVLIALTLAAPVVGRGTSYAQTQTLMCPSPGFGEAAAPAVPGVAPFAPMTSLKTVANPVLPKDASGNPHLRDDLATYIKDLDAAIQLGKAFFWDMQAGSDNKTACATCHFQAGADTRTRNQLHRGANGQWDGYAPNHALASGDFPFTDPAAPPDVDNIAGSQGIRKSLFKGIGRNGAESTVLVSDSVFSVNNVNVRQVTDKNAPATINAVFNHRNFFNGRAQPEFNGVNPFGGRDTSARVFTLDSKGVPVAVDIRIADASLASQAVGPPLNTVEMSAEKRTFPDLGKKLLALKPLGLQKVSPTDSVLGKIADATTGLKVSYATLIQQAFQPRWWNSKSSVVVNGTKRPMMEANFSLYWGLAIMLYEATLVADESPMDQYLATRVFDLFQLDPITGLPKVTSTPSVLDTVVNRLSLDGISVTVDEILKGLALFEQPLPLPGTTGFPAGTGVGCSLCHVGAETTSASVQNLVGHGLEPGDTAFKNLGFDLRLERMFMRLPPVPDKTDMIAYDPSTYSIQVLWIDGVPLSEPKATDVAVYDRGWYNIGVRPTGDDPGLGGKDPFGKFLSWTQLYQGLTNPSIVKVPGGGLGCATSPPAAPASSPFAGEVLDPLTGLPLLAGPLRKTEGIAVAGSFKVSHLRNVELNGPYFHTGGKSTLRQAVDLYDAGGHFANPTLSPLIRPLGLDDAQVRSLVAFMTALTDERVLFRRAPFDHPELRIPNGHNADGSDIETVLPAVGAAGAATPIQRFLNLSPFQN